MVKKYIFRPPTVRIDCSQFYLKKKSTLFWVNFKIPDLLRCLGEQFNIWLRRWRVETCSVAPHNSDLFGQCNYPSLATGERPSDQLAHWLVYLVNIQTKYRPLLAITGQPDLAMNHHGGAMEQCEAPAQACDARDHRFNNQTWLTPGAQRNWIWLAGNSADTTKTGDREEQKW